MFFFVRPASNTLTLDVYNIVYSRNLCMESLGKPAGSVWAQRQWNINSFFWGVIAPDFHCWMGGVHCLCLSHSGQLPSLQCFTLLQLLWYLQWSHSMQSPRSRCHSRPSYLPSLCLSVDFNISVSLSLSRSLFSRCFSLQGRYLDLWELLCALLGQQLAPVCVQLVPQACDCLPLIGKRLYCSDQPWKT